MYTPWSMTRFGVECYISLYHNSTSNYVEDGTLKIQSIHLVILKELIDNDLRANKLNFIAVGIISYIITYWVLRVKLCLFFGHMEAHHSFWSWNIVIGRYQFKYGLYTIVFINIRKWNNWWLITVENNINIYIVGQCIGRKY